MLNCEMEKIKIKVAMLVSLPSMAIGNVLVKTGTEEQGGREYLMNVVFFFVLLE